jgi:hypothetical protein
LFLKTDDWMHTARRPGRILVRAAFSSCLVLTLVATGPAFGQDQQAGSRLRCLDQDASRLVAQAKSWSGSVRLLVERIEQSDLIVFVRMDGLLTRYRGETRLVTAAPGARYVMVGINPRADIRELVSMLGHELQHVSEIADAPGVRDAAGMLSLFQRIGFPGTTANGFETGAAIDVGLQVAREVRSAVHSLPH